MLTKSLKTGVAVLFLFVSGNVFAQQHIGRNAIPSKFSLLEQSVRLPSTNALNINTQVADLKSPKKAVAFISIEFGHTRAGRSVTKSFYFDGALPGHEVALNIPRGASVPGAEYKAWVSVKDSVRIRYTNTSSESQNPGGAQTFRVRLR